MRLLITWGFRGQPIQRRHFWFQGSKGRCHGNQILAKIGQKITKMAITSVGSHTSMQSLVMRLGLCHRGIYLWYSRTPGTRGVTMATNFGTSPWQPICGQNRQKYHKNCHIFSCMQHIRAEFGFESAFALSRNSSVRLPYTRDKGALLWQPILGLK